MKILTLAIAGSSVTLFMTSPANAVTWFKDTVSGVLDSGTDIYGLFGLPGNDLAGVPYSFSMYYRDTDVVRVYGNNDFDATSSHASGAVGGFQIPFSVRSGGWSQFEDNTVYYHITSDVAKAYPRFFALLEGRGGGDPSFATIYYNNFEIGRDSGPVRFIANLGPGPIPEPATWLMMIAGFGAIGLAFRSRKARTAVSYG